MNIEIIKPKEIEKRSFEIISELLGDRAFPPLQEPVVKRVIHTTADFEYADQLYFSEDVVERLLEALRNGADIVTDTQMARAGVSKKTLERFGGKAHCFISDEDVAQEAIRRGVTRAVVSMEKRAAFQGIQFLLSAMRLPLCWQSKSCTNPAGLRRQGLSASRWVL